MAVAADGTATANSMHGGKDGVAEHYILRHERVMPVARTNLQMPTPALVMLLLTPATRVANTLAQLCRHIPRAAMCVIACHQAMYQTLRRE